MKIFINFQKKVKRLLINNFKAMQVSKMEIKRKSIMLPGPVDVPDEVLMSMSKPVINHRGEEFHQLMSKIEKISKDLFKTKYNVIILSSSGTGGAESAVMNIIRPGDKAIVPVFGEFSGRLAQQIEAARGKVIRVNAPLGTAPSIEQIEKAVSENKDAKAIYLVYNDTSPGTTYRYAKELGEIAEKYGMFYVIDAISVFGGDVLPMDEWHADVVIAGSQKCLFTPPGLALVGVSDDVINYVRKDPPYTTYFNYASYVDFLAKYETPFTPALPLFYALETALEKIASVGLERTIEKHKIGAQAYYSAFETMGLQPFVEERFRSNVVISIKYPQGVDDIKFRKYLENNYNIVITGGFGELKGKIFRIGNMGIIERSKILPTIIAVGYSMRAQGINVNVEKAIEVAEEKLKGLDNV